jgi:hypothetical protein
MDDIIPILFTSYFCKKYSTFRPMLWNFTTRSRPNPRLFVLSFDVTPSMWTSQMLYFGTSSNSSLDTSTPTI